MTGPSPFHAAFATPFADSPAGEDLTYDPAFQELTAEVEKLRALDGAPPDWRKVIETGIQLLQERTKDLRIAAWVVVAKANVEGWRAASDGLEAYAAMIESLWDVALPAAGRPKARVTLAEWLWYALGRALSARTPAADERDAVAAFPAIVMRVDEAFASRLKKQMEGAADLRKLAREHLDRLPQAPPPPAPSAAPPPSPVPAAPAAAGVEVPHIVAVPAPQLSIEEPPPPASLDEAEDTANRLRRPIETFARYVRTLAPAAPWGYRLARVGAWFAVEGLPHVEGGRTVLRAPSAPERTALERMAADGDWRDLLQASEDAFLERIYWLDVHRYSAVALENLGPAYAAARETIGRELVAFLGRVPDLPKQLFENRSPLASPATLAWIDLERARFGGGASGGPVPGEPAPSDAALAEVLSASNVQAGGGAEVALAKALALAQAPRTRPDRFRATLAVANFALAHDKRETALALFERLFPEVNDTLEAWEPEVCKEFFIGYLKALGKASSGNGPDDRQTLLFRRLLALDPASAFEHGG